MDSILPTALIWDTELSIAVPDRKHVQEPDIKYCAGFHDKKNMRFSVCVFWNTARKEVVYFQEGEMSAMQTYLDQVQVDYFVGFNNVGFDDPVAVQGEGIRLPEIERYDILREMYRAMALDPDRWNFRTHGGCDLVSTLNVNGFIEKKLEDGALAPILWQRNAPGDRQRVIRYCIDDVAKHARLWFHLLRNDGKLKNPRLQDFRKELQLATPWKALAGGA